MLIDVRRLAELLSCSQRHVWKLRAENRIPPPTQLGGMIRWQESEIRSWIAAGCPAAQHETEAASSGAGRGPASELRGPVQ